MATFEIQGPDGKTYEVQADTMEQAASALSSLGTPPQGGSTTDSQAVSELSDGMMGLGMGVYNGATFGFGDNIAGAANGLASMARGRGFANGYGGMRDRVRSINETQSRANPAEYMTGNVVGAAIPAIATGGAATGTTALGTAGRSMALGAAEGALQGAGNADGVGVARDAIKGAGIGAAAGVAAPAVVGLAAKGIRGGVLDPIGGMVGIGNTGKANRAIGSAVKSSGQTRDGIAALLAKAASQGQPEYRMMDALGTAGQRQASAVARKGGDAATEITDFLERRQIDQGDRVGSFIDEAFGTRGTTAAQTRDGLTAKRGAEADVAYDAARGNAAPVDVRGALGVIDARIGGMKGSGIAGDGIDGKLAGYRARLAGDGAGLGKGVTGAELSDFDRVLGVKQAVQDDIGAAVRAGRNNEARELGKLLSELDGALEGSSDMYRTANDGFRAASKNIEAVDTGAMMAARGRAADTVPAFTALGPDAQSAARVGYGDRLLTGLEANKAPTSNKAKSVMSTKMDAEAQAMALDPALYADRLARENTMWTTQNRALGGSKTADNLADQGAMEGFAGGALDVAKSVVRLDPMGALGKIGAQLGPLMKGQNEATRKLIAQALMSGNASEVLGPIMAQQAGSISKRRMIEALLRQPMREGGAAMLPN